MLIIVFQLSFLIYGAVQCTFVYAAAFKCFQDFTGGLIGRKDGRDKSRIVFNPFAVLCVSLRCASGLIVLHRINYHLLSAAEARTKREAPVLAFWKRNPLVATCDTNLDAEVDATMRPGFAPRRCQQWPLRRDVVGVATLRKLVAWRLISPRSLVARGSP